MVLTVLMVPAFVLVARIETANQAIIGFAFAGFACSAFFPLMVAVASEPCPQAVSWIASMLTAALMLGVGLGSYTIGLLKNAIALDQIYTYSSAYPVLALVLILASIRMRNDKTGVR